MAGHPKHTHKRWYDSRWVIMLVIGLLFIYNTLRSEPTATPPNPYDSNKKLLLESITRSPRTHLGLDKSKYDVDETKPDPNLDVTVHKAAVACDVPHCSTLATEILRRGGSAVDAAVTTALCIGSINSFSSGIGGGGFMVVRHPNGTSTAFNFREAAPALADKHMFDHNPALSKVGGLAVGVPGELAGLDAAFKMYTSGKLGWSDLVEPVANLNRHGFTVEEPLKIATESSVEQLNMTNSMDNFFWLFNKNSKGEFSTVNIGDTTFRPNFAHTLDLIAKNGSSDIFYDPEGPIAPHLVNHAKAHGGVISLQDFVDYKVEISEPIKTEFLGREVITSPNPASGPMLAMGLNVLNGFKDSIEQKDFSPIATQRLIETMKWMGAARSELGDPVDIDNTDRIDELTTQAWADSVRRNISDEHTLPWQDYHPAYESVDPHGTAHFSIIDENGMAVSMTTTVNLLFGAALAEPITGIVLNNEMDDFSTPGQKNAFNLEPSLYNYVAPFKRPLSSCVPAIISGPDGRPEIVIGAAGGSRISTAVFQAIVRKLQYDESMLNVIAKPRLHHQLLPDYVLAEPDVPSFALEELKKKGHEIVKFKPLTAMNGIYINPKTGLIHAVSDYWRKRGKADGY